MLMYQKNQNFLNTYKEIKDNEKLLRKNIISHSLNLSEVDKLSTQVTTKTHNRTSLINDTAYPVTPNILHNFKNHNVDVKFTGSLIPYVNLSSTCFNKNKKSDLDVNNHNEKKTVNYTATVLLTNPILRPIR